MPKQTKKSLTKPVEIPRFNYEIQGIKLTLAPLKIVQIKKLIGAVAGLQVADESDLNWQRLVEMILSDKLQEIGEILFGEAGAKVKWEEVEYETIEKVWADFLQLNPSLKKRLNGLLISFGWNPAD